MPADNAPDLEIRSWDSFFDFKKFKLPENVEKWIDRVHDNTMYYLANYLICACVFFTYAIVLRPTILLILAVCALLVFAAGSRRHRIRALDSRIPPRKQPLVILAGTAIVLLYFHSIPSLSSLLVSLCFLLAHSTLRTRDGRVKLNSLVGDLRNPAALQSIVTMSDEKVENTLRQAERTFQGELRNTKHSLQSAFKKLTS